MKGINLLSSQVSVLTQYNFRSSARSLNVPFYEADISIFNFNFFNFSTFPSLLKKRENLGEKSKDRAAETKRKTNTLGVQASESNEKRKTSEKNKSLTIRPEIKHNDLQVKLKQIQKFINKGTSVFIKIENSKNVEGGIEGILSQIQKSIAEFQMPAKISKTGPNLVITPIQTGGNADKKPKEETGSSTSSNLKSESEVKS